jgi:hypothetical protein
LKGKLKKSGKFRITITFESEEHKDIHAWGKLEEVNDKDDIKAFTGNWGYEKGEEQEGEFNITKC